MATESINGMHNVAMPPAIMTIATIVVRQDLFHDQAGRARTIVQ